MLKISPWPLREAVKAGRFLCDLGVRDGTDRMKTSRALEGDAGPGEPADPGQERLADLEQLEAGARQRGAEVALAQVPALDVAQGLEHRGGHQPAERPDGLEGAAARADLAERGAHVRGPPVREEDRVAPGLQRAAAR